MNDIPELPPDTDEPAPPAAADAEAAAPTPPASSSPANPPAPPAQNPASTGAPDSGPRTPEPAGVGAARPGLTEAREPLYREARGFRLRLDPPDLARLRELPGARGKTDRELGEEFFEKQADRLAESLADDVPSPAEVRVVVDPYSRQAFLAVEKTIRSILSF